MSAFIVSDKQINVLVSYAAKHGLIGLAAQKAAAAMLYEANVVSVNHRYNDTTPTTGFKFKPEDPDQYSPVAIVKLCHCLDYQSCEVAEWDTSNARKLVEQIRRHAGGLDIGDAKRPGYDAAPWTI